MKNAVKLLSLLMVVCMLLSACAQGVNGVVDAVVDSGDQNNTMSTVVPEAGITSGANTDNLSTSNRNDIEPEKGSYNEGVVLVKCDGDLTGEALCDLEYTAIEPLYRGSSWHFVTLGETVDTVEAVKYLTELDSFEAVDYDYIMKADGEVQSVDISGNTYAENLTYLETMGVKKGWEGNLNNGKTPGGSPDVVIAIIDTGVDYNHQDLRNNIWVNPAEIPDNGIDDDNNGYVDDIYGWNCVGDNNDPMDDNGHGTHVAGIAAAENNKIGTVGVAYNCKIMVLKAGNSSGNFNNSDIAEAVQYAYMNGASVINMSFGGYLISLAAEDALENAYHQCVLVAAAGNDDYCNQPGCLCPGTPCYPAALPYVIGVMSCNENGSKISGFSNFDHYPFGSIEYEVYACGESITSTWPNNKYATLSGTSMAAPTVAGIAAVLRSTYPDRDVYSNKYIQSQIVNTGTKGIMTHTVADLYEALTKIPTPSVNLYDYYIFDNVEFSDKNNGNGIIDAGETIHLAIELQNRGGVATNVKVSIDTMRNNDPALTDPYFTFVNPTMQLSDIGTYSVRESGDRYFEIIVSDDCPNDYRCKINANLSYANGMDKNDTTIYTNAASFDLTATNGVVLDYYYTKDTILPGNKRYIIAHDVTVREGVTLTFEAGATIQFYGDSQSYYDTLYNSPRLMGGTIVFNGTEENRITISTSELFYGYACFMYCDISSVFNYVDMTNCSVEHGSFSHCNIVYDGFQGSLMKIKNGEIWKMYYDVNFYADKVNDSTIDAKKLIELQLQIQEMDTSVYVPSSYTHWTQIGHAKNSMFISHSEYVTPFYVEEGMADNLNIRIAENNIFIQESNSTSIKDYTTLSFDRTETHTGNAFYGMYKTHPELLILTLIDDNGAYQVDVNDPAYDGSKVWPHIVSIEMFDKDGNPITTVGREEIKVRVTFNRAMDTTQDTFLTFGTRAPYADYRIEGEWISETVWEGSYTLKAQIENGQNFLKVNNACAKEDPTKTVFGEYQLYEFTIDTTAAMSMNLQANPTDKGIELTWFQDDYDTLLGYNIYRSTEKDGNYVKLNPAILLSTDESFVDENAEPGKTYWYTYTVVLTDFSESKPAGKVMATAKDTLAPNLYHTPVNQGYLNNNLVISCTASDNVAVASVVLYYRTTGTAEWKSLSMLKQNDKYSATVFGSELTLAGLEYYIVAYDTNNSIAKGSADAPYTVIIKDASAISRKGDVDGNGVVDAKDALMIMQCINGDLIMTDDEFKRADLNGDGILSSMEALRILQYINGNVNTLEM